MRKGRVEIRKGTIEDLKDFQELNNGLFEFEYKNFDDTLNVGWSFGQEAENYFKDLILNNITYVADVDGKVVGYIAGRVCNYQYSNCPFAELENMYILEDFRKFGIGTKLFLEFKNTCAKSNIAYIKVNSSAGNLKAIDFYKKNGFEDFNIDLKINLKNKNNI